MKKATGTAGPAAGSLLAPAIVWTWGLVVPDHPMPAEVAASLGVIVGAIVSYLTRWLP